MSAESRLTRVIAVLGWIVAVGALFFNYRVYQHSEQRYSDEMQYRQEDPLYDQALRSYNPDIFPDNLRVLEEPIPHEFEINHRSGRPIEEVVVQFFSSDREITQIQIFEGMTDSEIKIESSNREASIRKPEILPQTKLRGVVTTKGITKLKMVVAAKKGSDIDKQTIREPERISNFDWDIALYVGFLLLGVLIFTFLLFRVVPHLKISGVLDLFKSKEDNLSLLILVLFLTVFPIFGVSVGRIIDGLLLYFVVTRYKLLIDALKRISRHDASKSPK